MRNAKREVVALGYSYYWFVRAITGRVLTLWEVNRMLAANGHVGGPHPHLKRRSYSKWDRYYREGIGPNDYPVLNRYEIANSAIPLEHSR